MPYMPSTYFSFISGSQFCTKMSLSSPVLNDNNFFYDFKRAKYDTLRQTNIYGKLTGLIIYRCYRPNSQLSLYRTHFCSYWSVCTISHLSYISRISSFSAYITKRTLRIFWPRRNRPIEYSKHLVVLIITIAFYYYVLDVNLNQKVCTEPTCVKWRSSCVPIPRSFWDYAREAQGGQSIYEEVHLDNISASNYQVSELFAS